MAVKKNPSRADRLSEAMAKVLEAKEEIELLKDEIDNWKSNMEGTNLEYTYKYEQLEECYGVLEEIQDELENITDREGDVMFPGMF